MISQKELIYKLFETEKSALLIILDACRFDVFKQVNWISGKLTKVWSEGSSTGFWFRETFTSPLPDVTLVSPHPFFSSLDPRKLLPKRIFGKVVYVEEGTEIIDGGLRMGLAPAEYTTKKALLEMKRTNKLIVHYTQPHFPALGKPQLISSGKRLYDAVKKGNLELEFVKEAYRGNLVYVLREAEKLASAFPSNVIITSDHGELFGEGGFGHPPDSDNPILRTVPWLEVRENGIDDL